MLAVIVATPIIGFLNALALVPFLTVVAAELATSVAALGQVIALSMAVATVLGLVAGQFADRYGYQRTLLLGIITVVVSALGTAAAPTYGVLLVAGITGSVSRAVVAPISLTIAATWFSGTTRQRAIALVSASVAGAAVVGVPLLTMVAVVGGWRSAFVALGLVAASEAAFARWALPADHPSSPSALGVRKMLAAYSPLIRDNATLAVLGSNFLRSSGVWAMGTYVGAFLVVEHGLTVQQASLAFAAGGGGIFVGSLLAGSRVGAVPPRPLLVSSGLIGGVLIGAAMALPVAPSAVFALTFVGFVVNGIGNVASSTLLIDETRASRATTMSLNGAALSLSSAVGGSLGGLLLALGGYHLIGLAVPVSGALASLLICLSPDAPHADLEQRHTDPRRAPY
ncbi:MAG: MFS transporter [Chloroflexi bacterium]|nr:MFS transporter [Chloroflexota bacterium]